MNPGGFSDGREQGLAVKCTVTKSYFFNTIIKFGNFYTLYIFCVHLFKVWLDPYSKSASCTDRCQQTYDNYLGEKYKQTVIDFHDPVHSEVLLFKTFIKNICKYYSYCFSPCIIMSYASIAQIAGPPFSGRNLPGTLGAVLSCSD